MTYQAKVYFIKETQKDNWEQGIVDTHRTHIYDETMYFDFTDTKNLLDQFADFISSFFDVDKQNFLKYVSNEIENNRFDYCQNEDEEGQKHTLTEENPDGYLSDYTFLVVEVTRKGTYEFDEVNV